jgi:hypothetical protein
VKKDSAQQTTEPFEWRVFGDGFVEAYAPASFFSFINRSKRSTGETKTSCLGPRACHSDSPPHNPANTQLGHRRHCHRMECWLGAKLQQTRFRQLALLSERAAPFI